jgi:uncharacterized membrane protein
MSTEPPNQQTFANVNGMDTARIETLGDGIFAIVITLLVFELKVPAIPSGVDAATALPGMLFVMWPKFASWMLSFVMIGVYWQAHHGQYNMIRRVDRPLIWLNILFFMAISLIPFTAAMLGTYPQVHLALTCYGLNLIFVNLSLAAHWRHATNRHCLVDVDLAPATIAVGYRRILLPPAVYACAIVLSSISPWLGMLLFGLMPLAYIFKTPVDHFFLAPIRADSKARHIANAALQVPTSIVADETLTGA